jgi:Mrp family chromosome partitioning ATPase
LAVALSQIGVKTLLIDSNLRDPSVQNYFDVEDVGGGLRDCLSASDAAAIDFTHEAVLPNLDVLFAGTVGPNAQELIAAEAFSDLVNGCMRDYEMTIIDTPAANRCADGLRISTVAGFSLIVARKDRTMVSDVRALCDQLKRERVSVIGSVLNAY